MQTTTAELDEAIGDLKRGAEWFFTLPVPQRAALLERSIAGVNQHARRWVEAACAAKRLPAGSGARAEEILAGPATALRYLHLFTRTLEQVEQSGEPRLPGTPRHENGRWRMPIFPTGQLYDPLLFRPIQAEAWLDAEVAEGQWFGNNVALATGATGEPLVCLVLGAGNVSSIPITDALTKIFQNGQSVLLKMNPVNEYLGPIFDDAFAPLTETGLLRIVYGGAEVGAHAIEHEDVATIHITGSDRTHDAIVWGAEPDEQARRKAAREPLLDKPITSELGNVSPWIIVPGAYKSGQLEFQAENIAASITQNASFNCIATKMLITWKQWPGRAGFLDRVEAVLQRIPARHAYYPGAVERFERFAEQKAPTGDGTLPWVLRRDLDPAAAPHLFREESFVCVCGETALDAADEDEFLTRAVAFANNELWGTLSAALTVPDELQRRRTDQLDAAVDRLRYGVVGVNQWPGVAFALMSPPWGGYPGSTLADVQSGIGAVHNTYLLDRVEKTVLRSAPTIWPKPMWFSTHKRPEAVAWNLLQLYQQPSVAKLPSVFWHSLLG